MKIEDINYEIKKPEKEKNSNIIYSHLNLALSESKKNFESLGQSYKVDFINGNISENIFIYFEYDSIKYKIKNSNKELVMSIVHNNEEKIIISSRQAKNQSLRYVYSNIFNKTYLSKISLQKQISSLCTLVRNEQRKKYLKEKFYRIPEDILRLSKRKNFYSELVIFIIKNKEAFDGKSFPWDELNLISLFTDNEIPTIISKYKQEKKMEKIIK